MSRRLGVDEKREREKQVVSKMIDLYCHKKHKTKGEICADCKALKDYAQLRSCLLYTSPSPRDTR